MWKRKKSPPCLIGLSVLAVFVGGCAVGPDYIRPSAPEPKAWIEKEDPKLKSEPVDLSLLGQLPSELNEVLGKPEPIPTVPAEVAVGVPAELLRRRPDIRAAERQMAAQSGLIGVAKADLYPAFSLFGNIGLRTSDAFRTAAGFPGGSSLSDLFNSDSVEFIGGPAFTWNLFN